MTTFPPGFAWLAAGLVLAVLEAFAPGAFMVWIGLAALGTGVATLVLDLGFAWEVAVFAMLAALSVAAALVLRTTSTNASRINTPGSGLVGRTAHALAFEGREGRVRIGDSDWPARLAGANGTTPPSSTPLDVIGIEGMVLLVRPRGDQPRAGSPS